MGIKKYSDWKRFSEGKEKVSVFVTAEEIFIQSPLDKERTNREFVKKLFKEKGLEITRFGHDYDKTRDEDYWGLVFHRTDSDIIERTEITAIIGVNARRVDAINITKD